MCPRFDSWWHHSTRKSPGTCPGDFFVTAIVCFFMPWQSSGAFLHTHSFLALEPHVASPFALVRRFRCTSRPPHLTDVRSTMARCPFMAVPPSRPAGTGHVRCAPPLPPKTREPRFARELFAGLKSLPYLCTRLRKAHGAIAQLVEQRTENPCVPGSIPGGTTCKRASRHLEALLRFPANPPTPAHTCCRGNATARLCAGPKGDGTPQENAHLLHTSPFSHDKPGAPIKNAAACMGQCSRVRWKTQPHAWASAAACVTHPDPDTCVTECSTSHLPSRPRLPPGIPMRVGEDCSATKKKSLPKGKLSHAKVGLPGLEPGKAGPESAVLPLHHSPIIKTAASPWTLTPLDEGWATRTRTRKGRTRICSVTITP